MNKAYFKYLLALILFGSNGVVANYIHLSSFEIVLLRSVLGSILLVGLFFLTGNKITAHKYKKDLLFIVLSGLAMAADWLFLFEAFNQIGVSLTILINYSGPAIVIALSPILFNEKVTSKKIIGLIAALIGVFLISGVAITNGLNTWGIICAVLSAFSYAAMVIFNKKSEKVKGIENSTLQLFSALLIVAIFVGIKQGYSMNIAAGDWIPILWLGFLNTGIACLLYFSSIGELPVQTVAISSYIEPVSAVFFSVTLLNEKLLPLQILGAVLVLGGAAYAEGLINFKIPGEGQFTK
ncbi:MAG: EamA family transporter [Clostridiaceae bacterium]